MRGSRTLAAALGMALTSGTVPTMLMTATPGAALAAAADCPVARFPSVAADPANRRYPNPVLRVSCTDRHLVIESNGIPSYAFQRTTPNELREHRYVWRVPLRAELADDITSLPLLGPIAVTINGLPIYGPNEGPRPDSFGDPVANGILDRCLGHTARRGDYHYHALIVACLSADQARDEPSPLIAYAFDGFAIYGSRGCRDSECREPVTYQSGWTRTADPRTHAWDAYRFDDDDDPLTLDACNGHRGPDGDYHYHATATFPYILGCYRGYVDPAQGHGRRFRSAQ